MAGDFCNACGKPFDEVHPLDWMNDITCREFHGDRKPEGYYPIGYRPCRMNHTWREHVQKSYRDRGQTWFNPHYRVPATNFVRKTE